jgi:hypothetical protein
VNGEAPPARGFREEALGARKNLRNRQRLERVSNLVQGLRVDGGERQQREMPELRDRQPVLDAVTAVLRKNGRWMGPKEIWLAAELLLGRPVSRSSVRNCLVTHLEGRKACFEKDGGCRRYRLLGRGAPPGASP